jgi:hypothetical protein
MNSSPRLDSQCVKVNPTWAKGYARKGAALHGQRRYVEAIETYETGLKIEDSPALRKGLEEVKAAKGALGCVLPSRRTFTHMLVALQRRTSAAMEQSQWAWGRCSVIRACLQSSPPTHVPPSTSQTPALCKKCVHFSFRISLHVIPQRSPLF